jgi:hypothetical protein
MSNETVGVKYDSGKPRFGLIPPYAIEEVAKVLTVGAQKYSPNNWKYVENGQARYVDAMSRHLNSFIKGESTDPETGLHHLAHAICCAMFIVDADISGTKLIGEVKIQTPEKDIPKDTVDYTQSWPLLDEKYQDKFYDRKK